QCFLPRELWGFFFHKKRVFVARCKRDIWIVNLSSTRCVSSIIYTQPPFASVWATEFPLVGSMHSFCLVCVKSVSSPIQRLLRCRILRPARRCIQGTCTKRYKHSYACEVEVKGHLSFHQRIL